MKQNLSPKVVLVIGEKEDAHLPFVKRHLSTPLIVIDAAATMAGEELNFSLQKGELRITHRDRLLDNVTGVWLRGRRIPRPLHIPVPPVYQEYSKSALLGHTNALYAHLEKSRWVSDYYAIQRAEHKPLQLHLAARLGFSVPDTIFTSSPIQARQFIDSYAVSITKPIGRLYITDKERGMDSMFFTTKIRKGEEVDLSGLSVAPAIFQQAIDAVADLRVIVIGDKVFPAIIMDKKLDPDSPIRDWRIAPHTGEMHIEPYKLPKDIADKCLTLVKKLGLQYGAIDLVLDKKGNIWFLENNPNGQWAFVEEATGQPIGKALADLLQGTD